MKRSVMLALGIAVAPLAAAHAAGPWDGTYVFEQGLGKGAGGMALFITHTLKIDGSDCRLDAEGVQTDAHIRCKATANGDKLEVAFVSFKDGSMKNQFGKNEHTANQPLFTLTRKGNSIATTWQGYNKNEASTAGPPTFRKER